MTNEEKAKELADYYAGETDYKEDAAYSAATEMAQWKDKQMIEKVCNYLYNNIDKDLVIYHDNTWLKRDEFVKRFKKAMEE